MKSIRAKIYVETPESCCIATLSQCRGCKEKDSCLILREQYTSEMVFAKSAYGHVETMSSGSRSQG